MSVLSTVAVPAQLKDVSFYGSFDFKVKRTELEQMRTVAGIKVRHYFVTPQQAMLITCIFLAITSAALGIALSPAAWVGAAVAIAIGIYCFYRKDMNNEKVREAERQKIAHMHPIQLAKQPEQLATLIDYDLGNNASFEKRLHTYCLLSRLSQNYRLLLDQKLQLETHINNSFTELECQPTHVAKELQQIPLQEANLANLQIEELRKELNLKLNKLDKLKREQSKTRTKTLADQIKKDEIALEIVLLKESIAHIRRQMEQLNLEKLEYQRKASAIAQQLRQVLTPLQNWQYESLETIRMTFEKALASLLRTYQEACLTA